MRMKAAPPLLPTSVGNLHTLPSPTAEPAAASTTPNLLPKFFLVSIATSVLSVSYQSVYEYRADPYRSQPSYQKI